MLLKDKNITGVLIYIKLDYGYVSHSEKYQFRILIANFQRTRAFEFHFLPTTRNFSEIQRSILLIMIICEILLFIFIFLFLKIKIHMCGIGDLSRKYYKYF